MGTVRYLFGLFVLISVLLLFIQVARSPTGTSSHQQQTPTSHSDLLHDFSYNLYPQEGILGNTTLPGYTAVLILSYQRSGSSFFGGIFDQAPRGLYVYEPLDGLYGAMYGTPEGWNVPGDIMNHRNGALREIPADESQAVSTFLANLLQCKYQEMPTEFQVHRFWLQFQNYESTLHDVQRCVATNKLHQAHTKCHGSIRHLCPHKFGVDARKQEHCHEQLWTKRGSSPAQSLLLDKPKDKPFKGYISCMDTARILGTRELWCCQGGSVSPALRAYMEVRVW